MEIHVEDTFLQGIINLNTFLNIIFNTENMSLLNATHTICVEMCKYDQENVLMVIKVKVRDTERCPL